jgi:hypothetical protein
MGAHACHHKDRNATGGPPRSVSGTDRNEPPECRRKPVLRSAPAPLRLCAFPPPLRYDFSANGFTSALPHILSYWSWYFLASADLPCRSNA